MKLKLKDFLIPVILAILLIASFSYGKYTGRLECKICPPEEVDFSLFWQTWDLLQEKYVDKTKLNTQEMIYGAISGMVNSLEDPYTVFFKPDETKRFIDDVKGTFEGVGMEVGIREGQVQVIAPLEGTPAQKAGLRAGDKIIMIDGKPTADLTVEEVINLIRGQRGTAVTLTIYRQEWGENRDIKIVRQVIEIPSLKLEIKENNIAYLRIYQFSENAAYDFSGAAVEILNSPAQKIVLDLRDNPGGYLEVAQDIAGWFLKEDSIVALEDKGIGKEKRLFKAEGNTKLSTYPVVVLINGGSASGSEILAGALRDNRGVKLIGETSFGKGSVQELEELREGSSLKITTAKWLTPNGESISEKGLEPDIKIEMTEADYQSGKDPQLDKAIEVLNEMR